MTNKYQKMKDWELPKNFPNDLVSAKQKKQMFEENGNGWWVYEACKPKFVPEKFRKGKNFKKRRK